MRDSNTRDAVNTDMPQDYNRQLAAVEQLPPDIALLKMENEQIFSIARMKPRDPVALVKQLKDLIEAYPAAADDAIYVKPVGTMIVITCRDCKTKYEVSYIGKDGVTCPKCESDKIGSQVKKKKFAEGLSIRAAESIRSVFGFTRLSIRMEVLPDDKVVLQGVLVDYCAGNITADERVVSPYYRSRQGNMQRHPEDRFLNVIVKAEKAKLRRDVILDSVPNIVKQAFRDACEKKLEKLVDKEQIEKKVIPYFASKGVSLEQIEKLVGREITLGWTQADVIMLSKIKTALENEETTVAELMADLEEGKQPAPTGPVSGANLSQPAAGEQKSEGTPVPSAQESASASTPPPQNSGGGVAESPSPAQGLTNPTPPSNKVDGGPEPQFFKIEDYAAQQEWATEAASRYKQLVADNKEKPNFNVLLSQFQADLVKEREKIGNDAFMSINDELVAAYKEWAKHHTAAPKKGKKS